jgi:hypothetical protein
MSNVILAAIALFLTAVVALGATDYVLALIAAPVLATIAGLLAVAIGIAPVSAAFTPPLEWGPHQGQ